MTARTAAVGLVFAALVLPAAAQVHRWVDEHGRVHYGDRPLATSGTTMRIRKESGTAPGGAADRVAPRVVADAAAGEGAAARGTRPASQTGPAARDRLLARRAACARQPQTAGC